MQASFEKFSNIILKTNMNFYLKKIMVLNTKITVTVYICEYVLLKLSFLKNKCWRHVRFTFDNGALQDYLFSVWNFQGSSLFSYYELPWKFIGNVREEVICFFLGNSMEVPGKFPGTSQEIPMNFSGRSDLLLPWKFMRNSRKEVICFFLEIPGSDNASFV